MRQFFIPAIALSALFSSAVFAQSENQLNYNIVNVQAEATRQVSNDLMNATLYIERSNKQPAKLATQITQLMNQATALTRK